ncbi:MAG: hypothetical protein WD037_04430 [Balneolales bacterium]
MMNILKKIWKYTRFAEKDNRDYVTSVPNGGFHLDIDKYYQIEENRKKLKEITDSEFAKSFRRKKKEMESSTLDTANARN